MQILLKSATIIEPTSSFHLKQKDILVSDGVISEIEDSLALKSESGMEIDLSGSHVSIGWFDMSAHFQDPGNEHKEDIHSGIAAAAAGGFTDVALLPNTSPTIDSKNQVEYLLSKCSHSPVKLRPIVAITRGCEGAELTEMIDLYEAGAVAFSDGIAPVSNTDILLKTLQYLQRFNGLLINRPEDAQLNLFGTMHEGVVSTTLGLKGMPSIAETIMIQRDLKILEYTGGKIHFSNLSCAESVDLIKAAKAKGLSVSCDVAAHQLVFDEHNIEAYNSNYKVNPPFRLEQDRMALIEGIKNGVIDAVVSSHQPHDPECKELEFDLADFGVTGLQTVFPILNQLSSEISLSDLITLITTNPRKLLGLEIPKIEVGRKAVLTIFNQGIKWQLDHKTNQSKSENSPFFGRELRGNALGIINGDKYKFSSELISNSN